MTKGKLKNLDAIEVGNEVYPPNPITKSAFSFFKIIIDFIKEKKIKINDKILLYKFLLVRLPILSSYDLNFDCLFKKALPLLSVTKITSYFFHINDSLN